MKKLLLTIATVSALTLTGVAQNNQKAAGTEQAPLTPEQKADKETNNAAAKLGLTDDQKAKFKVYALDRVRSNNAIREKAKASKNADEKKAFRAEAKANHDKFSTNVNSILTSDQQIKWAAHQKKVEEKRAKNQQHD
jgi:hypothetical protein